MTTVRNTSIDLVRRYSHYREVPVEQAAAIEATEAHNERDQAYLQVRAIIDKDLSANQRAIIDMREMQGMEFDDIAARLGMQPATVRVELIRARKRIREIYRKRKES